MCPSVSFQRTSRFANRSFLSLTLGWSACFVFDGRMKFECLRIVKFIIEQIIRNGRFNKLFKELSTCCEEASFSIGISVTFKVLPTFSFLILYINPFFLYEGEDGVSISCTSTIGSWAEPKFSPCALGVSPSLISPSSCTSGVWRADDSANFFPLPETGLGTVMPSGRHTRRSSANNPNLDSDSFDMRVWMSRSSAGRALIASMASEYPRPSGHGLIPEKMKQELE